MLLCKRLADLVASVALLAVMSPLILLSALGVLVSLGRPVLFRQQRPGRYGKPFGILKFRTMRDCMDQQGKPLPDCERLTGVGRLLRAWSLDELPQLLNVIRGEMSLVGPRPMLRGYLTDCAVRQLHRYEVQPGITGLAQISGRKSLDYDKRFELDTWYVQNWSLWLDLRILLATPLAVLRPDGREETGQPVAADAFHSVRSANVEGEPAPLVR